MPRPAAFPTRFWPAYGLWRHPDFLRFWAAQALSAFGSRITRTAIPVVAILSVGAAPSDMALLAALSLAPGVLVGLVAGGIVDRSRKRPILVAADLVRAVLVASVPIAAWAGWLGMPQLYAVAVLVGAATSLFQISDNAFLPVLVGRAHLLEGNAKLEATDSVAEIAGPGAAGVLIQALTAPIAMLVDAATYLWSALMIGLIGRRESAAASRREAIRVNGTAASAIADPSTWRRLRDDVTTGLRASLGHRFVGPTFVVAGITAMHWGFFSALYMLYCLRTLGLDPATVGLIVSMGGIGGLSGALFARRLAARFPVGPAMLATLAVSSVANIAIPLADGPRWLVLTLLTAHQLIGDGFAVAYLVHAVTLRQTSMPDDVLGRVNATLAIIIGVVQPAAALTAGPLAESIGVRQAVWVGVSISMVAPIALALSPVRALGAFPSEPDSVAW